MYCPNCGKRVADGASFCPFCATSLNNCNQVSDVKEEVSRSKEVNEKTAHNEKEVNKKTRNLLIIFSIIIIVFVIVFVLFQVINAKKYNKYSSLSDDEVVSVVRDEDGTVKFIDGTFSNKKVKNEEEAYAVLEELKDELKFKNARDEFLVENIETSENITYYRFHQKYKDIEVYGNNLILSVDSSGKVLSMSGYYVPNIELDVDNKKSKEEVEQIVLHDASDVNAKVAQSVLSIYADSNNQRIVFIVDLYLTDKIVEYIVDASTGEIINVLDLVDYVAYSFTGEGVDGEVEVTLDEFYDMGAFKTRYRLVDPTRNIEIVDARGMGADALGFLLSEIFSSWTPMVGDIENGEFVYFNDMPGNKIMGEIGLTALKNYEYIYDYYYNVLGRDSYDNKGSKIIVNVGMREKTFSSVQLENAAWLSLTNQMYIGYLDGVSLVKSLDVLGHEITHGVISKTAKFAGSPREEDYNKAFETGALNEAISDILGSLIEDENWTINESVRTVRSLSDPNSFNMPKAKNEEFYFPDGYLDENRTLEQFLAKNNLGSAFDYDDGGVHHNATVPGYAAYLMYTNGAFESKEEMAKVWYNSLFLMSSYSNFEDCALAVIKTAKNLNLSSDSVRIIEEAFMETNMLEDTRVEVSGIVSSGEVNLSDVKIELIAKNSQNKSYSFTTDENGKFSKKIETGTYELIFTKNGFEEYKKIITIHGDTTINIELANIKKQEDNHDLLNCKGSNCHTFTLFLWDLGLNETYEVYSVEDNTVLGTDVIIEAVNSVMGSDFLQTDGEVFTMSVDGLIVDFSWYYKDTDIKFDFNKPIVEDIAIEMKFFDGQIDNNFFNDIFDVFNP